VFRYIIRPFVFKLRQFLIDKKNKKWYKIFFNWDKRESLLRGKERYDIILMDILYNEFYEKNNN